MDNVWIVPLLHPVSGICFTYGFVTYHVGVEVSKHLMFLVFFLELWLVKKSKVHPRTGHEGPEGE